MDDLLKNGKVNMNNSPHKSYEFVATNLIKWRNDMNRKIIITGVLGLLIAMTAPVFAESTKDMARIEKLEERTRDLEARMAKVEASSQSHKQMGMKQHDHDMMDKGMANHPMGQMPQQAPQQNPPMGNMPQGGAQQPQGGGMPAGGMGDM